MMMCETLPQRCFDSLVVEGYAQFADGFVRVRCKDCIYWQDRKVQMKNGKLRDYLPDEEMFVTSDKGINVGAHCTLHGYENMSGSWFWAQANDFCSKGVKRNEKH